MPSPLAALPACPYGRPGGGKRPIMVRTAAAAFKVKSARAGSLRIVPRRSVPYNAAMTERHFAYPIVLDLAGRRAVVVGGGRVALRKALALAEAGAEVTAVAPEFLPDFAAATGATGAGGATGATAAAGVACVREAYEARHVAGAAVVIAATDDEAVNRRAADDARAAGALVNVVDVPALCDFLVPAQVRRGDLLVTVSTGGAAPSLSRRLRERLEGEFGPEWAPYLSALRAARERVLSEGHPPEVRRRIFRRLTEPDVFGAARAGPEALRRAIDAAVAEGRGA